MEHRKKHGWPFWSAVVLIVLPILYVASFGPACWLTSVPNPPAITGIPPPRGMLIYWPLGRLACGKGSLSSCLRSWMKLRVEGFGCVVVPTDMHGDYATIGMCE